MMVENELSFVDFKSVTYVRIKNKLERYEHTNDFPL